MATSSQNLLLKRKNSEPHQSTPRPHEPTSPLVTSPPCLTTNLKRECSDSSLTEPQQKCHNLPELPRELIDAIITQVIQLHHDDPTYQWGVLRHITRFHRKEIEDHFQVFWPPKLTVSVYPCPNSRANFEYRLCDNSEQEPDHGKVVKFVTQSGLQQRLGRCSHGKENEKILVRLGEGILNEGYAGSGIVSDAIVPGLIEKETWKYICFDWKKLFDNVFSEEMVMRRATKKLITIYTNRLSQGPQQESSDPADAAKRRLALVHFLRVDTQLRLRYIVHAHRANHQNNISKPWDPFDLALPLRHPSFSSRTGNPIFPAVLQETSVVFMIPGWRGLGIRELARLRGEELRRNCSDGNMRWYIAHVTYKSPEMLRGWIGRRAWNGKKNVRCWEGREVEEEVLEVQLRMTDGGEEHGTERWRMFPPERQVQRIYC